MSALPKRFFTPEEYLELEVKAEYKSQYVAGEIFAMAGTGLVHNEVVLNILTGLRNQFRSRACPNFISKTSGSGSRRRGFTPTRMSWRFAASRKFEGKKTDPPSLLNPEVIFEVLSPSTEAFDRGDKFARYRRLETLRDYVLVSADRMRVEHHHLQDNGVWAYADHGEPGRGAAPCQRRLRTAPGGNLRAGRLP